MRMASLWKECVNLLYSQVVRVRLSLYELSQDTLVYNQAEGQDALRQAIMYYYKHKRKKKKHVKKQFPTWIQNWLPLCSLACCSPCSCKELDTTGCLNNCNSSPLSKSIPQNCWHWTTPEGVQGGVRHSVLQEIWWDRSLDRCFRNRFFWPQSLHILIFRKAINPIMMISGPHD